VCGGFAAERPAGRRYQSIVARRICSIWHAVQQTPALSSSGAAARRSAANSAQQQTNAGIIVLTADA